MKYNMYSICDKATSFIYPFPGRSDQEAIRQFAVEMNNTPIGRDNPGDFDLYRVGIFDDQTGRIESVEPAVHVRSGMSVVKKDGE